ncbi:hypothetical protein ASD88_14315 [Pelomonas sp. Root662]|nr:hypothetical protein ASC81_15790 [Pelomonas sp. Root405]KRA70999.1 hypothetical protein ASD88_14315 [Pelomonas sp. Root662]
MTLAALTLLPATAQAAAESWGRSETQVRVGGQPIQFKADPDDRWLRQVDGFTVLTGVDNFSSAIDPWTGNLMAATANASFSLEAGRPRMELLTAADAGTYSYATAGGVVFVTGTITGTPGARGLVTFDGSFAAAVAPSTQPALSSAATVDLGAGLVLTGAGQSACRSQRCQAFDSLTQSFDNGSHPLNGLSKPFSLSLEASVGDSFHISFNVGATASNGYFVLIGQPAGVPLNAPAGLDALAASANSAATAPGSFAGIGGLRLSNGLGVSADSGLLLQPDGRWTPPSPVPEPAAGWLLSFGLAGLWLRRWLGAKPAAGSAAP